MNLLEKAKELINDFCLTEYGENADFSDLSKIPLAYTTDESGENEIQVDVNLIDLEMTTYINEKVVENIVYDSLEDLVTELEYLDFDNLTSKIFEEEK